LTNDQLAAAIDFIHDHIGESLELGSISRAAGLSEFHFARLFKAAHRGHFFPVRDPYADGTGQAQRVEWIATKTTIAARIRNYLARPRHRRPGAGRLWR